MFKIIGIIIIGVVVGIILRGRVESVTISKIMTAIIYLLLLILGIAVGANPQIMDNLGSLGAKALIITLGSVLCSSLIAMVIYNKLFKKSK